MTCDSYIGPQVIAMVTACISVQHTHSYVCIS